MDYEKKYKEAFERVKKLLSRCKNNRDRRTMVYRVEDIESIFPELAESEDEKIKEDLIEWISDFPDMIWSGHYKKDVIAWLEKQESCYSFEIKKGHWYKCVCDYMLNNSDLMFKNDRLYYCRSNWRLRGEIDERNVKNIGVNGYKSFFRPATNQEIKEWLEKQGEQKQDVNVQINPSEYINNIGGNGCYLKNATQTSTCSKKEEKVDNQNCVKSIYDVKPKFKVGDWISNDMCDVHIASIENGMYYFDEGDGLSIVFVDEHYHLWTIEDAMDGDVLVSRKPFIYGKQCPYGGLDWYNDKFIKASNFIFTDSPVHPATKEQRELLFQKMKEAGYEWDSQKKELKEIDTYCQENCKGFQETGKCFADGDCKAKREAESTDKVEQSSINEITIPFGAKDSELQEATYYIPKGFHAEINDDKVVIKKGEKPTAWSEEDDAYKLFIISAVEDYYDEKNPLRKNLVDWIKSIKQRIGG